MVLFIKIRPYMLVCYQVTVSLPAYDVLHIDNVVFPYVLATGSTK